MKKEFIETSVFNKLWNELKLNDDDLRNLQKLIMQNPKAGRIIEGTGGASKIRFALQGKGKSGGIRAIYADITHKERIYLLLCYSKAEQEDLTAEQKQQLKALLKKLKGD